MGLISCTIMSLGAGKIADFGLSRLIDVKHGEIDSVDLFYFGSILD